MADGLHAAHLYAFEKLGFLVTELNMHLFDAEDLQAWEDAIDEWIEAHPEQEAPNGAA